MPELAASDGADIMLLTRGDTCVLIATGYSSLKARRGGYIKLGATGEIVASRVDKKVVDGMKLAGEMEYLVKFKGHGGPRAVKAYWIVAKEII